jgi:hypothetical protein
MALEVLTRYDEIRRNVLGYSGTSIAQSGTWVSRDANGNAIAPSAGGVGPVQLIVLGNENARPDSVGSETITVQYGQNRFAVGTEGYVGTPVVGNYLAVDSAAAGQVGFRLRVASGSDINVAICEQFVAGRLQFRTLQ